METNTKKKIILLVVLLLVIAVVIIFTLRVALKKPTLAPATPQQQTNAGIGNISGEDNAQKVEVLKLTPEEKAQAEQLINDFEAKINNEKNLEAQKKIVEDFQKEFEKFNKK